MKPSENAYNIIKQFEGCRLKAYIDPVGIPTIGYGTIQYPDGNKVKITDRITQDDADVYLKYEVLKKTGEINHLLKSVNQNQFDALVSFAYNVGTGALKKSTLLKKVNINPNDKSIELEFLKWSKGRVKGVLTTLPGLSKRRQAESDLYFY